MSMERRKLYHYRYGLVGEFNPSDVETRITMEEMGGVFQWDTPIDNSKMTLLNSFPQWLKELPTQTLTDELKETIIDGFRAEIIRAVNHSAGYTDEMLWEEGITITKGDQYYEQTYEQ